MKQQPDTLFREKLEQHSMPAPEAAWSRIEANLTSTSVYRFWWKIAASIALLAVVLAWLMPMGGTEKKQLAVDNPKITMPAPSVEKKTITEKSVKNSLEKGRKKDTKFEKKEKNDWSTPKKKYTSGINLAKQENTVAEVVKIETSIEATQEESVADVTKPIQQNETPAESVQEEIENTTVVLVATEVNSKYLLKVKPTNATSSNQKTSSFRKLLDKASDLKNNQEAIGNLRQKKNEILALNSDRYRNRNEKRERNN